LSFEELERAILEEERKIGDKNRSQHSPECFSSGGRRISG
jgi:hypothetical protein